MSTTDHIAAIVAHVNTSDLPPVLLDEVLALISGPLITMQDTTDADQWKGALGTLAVNVVALEVFATRLANLVDPLCTVEGMRDALRTVTARAGQVSA